MTLCQDINCKEMSEKVYSESFFFFVNINASKAIFQMFLLCSFLLALLIVILLVLSIVNVPGSLACVTIETSR